MKENNMTDLNMKLDTIDILLIEKIQCDYVSRTFKIYRKKNIKDLEKIQQTNK